MSNSPLATYRRITKHKNSPRRHKIDTITIHCMAGQMSGRACADYFATVNKDVSANYCVGYDGDIAISVDETDRSWCSCSGSNDHRAITIEVATDDKPPYACTAKAYNALLDLVTDICRRNGIEQLRYTGDTSGNMTMHKWFAATACPGDYLAGKFHEIQNEVNRRLAGKQKTEPDAGENYLTYPVKNLKIKQTYTGETSHAAHSGGAPADYPIDEACADGGREWFYCPCDNMRIAHIYGVNNDKKTNTIWLESLEKVKMPCGSDFVTILVTHPNDDDLAQLREGQIFTRGQPMFREGDDGRATGYHFHIAVGTGRFVDPGWVLNNAGAWVNHTTGRQLKPEEAFFINPAFTRIIDAAGLEFVDLPQAPVQMIYRVQIGAFSEKKNADAYAAKARGKGFPTVIKTETVNGVQIYRVQCGAFKEKKNAEAFAEKLKKAGFDVVTKEG